MSVKISWNNKHEYEKIRIYRSESKIELDALPTVHSEVAGTATSYVDAMARVNTVYHYRLGKVSLDDGVERFSEDQVFGNFPTTGHGWPKLIRGNWENGYAGTLSQSEFIRFEDLCGALSQRLIEPLGEWTHGGPGHWHKVIRNGKILFFPDRPVGGRSKSSGLDRSVCWDMLYRAGAVYGEGTGPTDIITQVGITPVNQDLSVERDGLRYRVRLPRLLREGVDTILNLSDLEKSFNGACTHKDFLYSEYAELLNAIRRNSTVSNNASRLANEEYVPVSYWPVTTRQLLGQEIASTNTGLRALVATDLILDGFRVLTAPAGVRPNPMSPNHAFINPVHTSLWWPVLELILE